MILSEEDRVFVASARVAHLATASPDGVPHIVPVCFALDGDIVYSAIDAKPKRVPPRKLRRVQNILANPRAMLLVDRYEEDWSRLRYILIRARADLLVDGPEWAGALRLLREKYPQYRSMPGFEGSFVVRLAIEHATTWP